MGGNAAKETIPLCLYLPGQVNHVRNHLHLLSNRKTKEQGHRISKPEGFANSVPDSFLKGSWTPLSLAWFAGSTSDYAASAETTAKLICPAVTYVILLHIFVKLAIPLRAKYVIMFSRLWKLPISDIILDQGQISKKVCTVCSLILP